LTAARESLARSASLPAFEGASDLDARIRVVHGREEVAELDGDFEAFAGRFARWIGALEQRS
jgi:hypothetical protein